MCFIQWLDISERLMMLDMADNSDMNDRTAFSLEVKRVVLRSFAEVAIGSSFWDFST